MKNKTITLLILLFLTQFFFSCKKESSNESVFGGLVLTKDKIKPFKKIDELAGRWEGFFEYEHNYKTGGEYDENGKIKPNSIKELIGKDSLKIDFEFNGQYLILNFNLINGGIEYSYDQRTSFTYNPSYINKESSVDTLTLDPLEMTSWDGTNRDDGVSLERYDEILKIYPKLKIIKLDDNTLKLFFDLNKVNELLKKFNFKDRNNDERVFGHEVFKSPVEFVIKKTKNNPDFWYYNNYRNIENYNGNPNRPSGITEGGDHQGLATREQLAKYLGFGILDTRQWIEYINKLSETGSAFELDLNQDKLTDYAGYYTVGEVTGERVYFKIYLNNGVEFKEVFSEPLDLNHYIGESDRKKIFTKDKLKNIDVIRINYVGADLTNYLYYDKLEGKITEYLTD